MEFDGLDAAVMDGAAVCVEPNPDQATRWLTLRALGGPESIIPLHGSKAGGMRRYTVHTVHSVNVHPRYATLVVGAASSAC